MWRESLRRTTLFVRTRRNSGRQFWTPGIGTALREANARIDNEVTQLAEAIQYYANPIPIATNVDERWRPVIRPGSFVHLPRALPLSVVGETPPSPTLHYLQASLDIAGLWHDVDRHVSAVLEGLRVPAAAARMDANALRSGISIIAEQAPLLTRARHRQRAYLRYETNLAHTCFKVASAYYQGEQLGLAADRGLVLSWPEPIIPIPGPDRDAADQAELTMGLASRLQILMRRRGITREQAEAELHQIDSDNQRFGVGPGVAQG